MNRTTNVTPDYTEYMYDYTEDDICGDAPFFPPPNNVSHFVVELLIFTLGFIGNVVTVAVISCWRKLHTPTFTMIACLAVSDAYSLLSATLYAHTNLLWLTICLNPHSSMIFYTFYVLLSLGRFNAGMQLCALVCLRFTAIVYPHKYKAYCTCKAVIMVSLVTSIFILIFCAVHSTFVEVLGNNCVFNTSICAVNFIVPCTFFISLHCLKLRALRRSPALNNNSSLKMNIVLSILMSIYVISSASMMLNIILRCFYGYTYDEYLNFINRISFSCNCAINPYVYFFSSPAIVQLFRKMWHRLCNRCQVTDNTSAEELEMNNIRTAWC